jgi:formylglycine-generating enzyme required for sulfatase activity
MINSKYPHERIYTIVKVFNGGLMPAIILILLCTMSLPIPSPTAAFEPLVTGRDGGIMVLIPEGEFIMGLPDNEPGSERNPLRRVYLRSFYIDKYEVTNILYKKCVSEGICRDPSLITDYAETVFEDGKKWYRDAKMQNYPVVGITWRQAGIYCEWAGKRLPATAEWEKAARGTDGRKYPWGNEWDGRRANWDEGGRIDGFGKVAPIGLFPQGASPYGVMDMAGNVREWVDSAVLKGGSWYSNPASLRAGDPGHDYIVERDDDMGFRCAMDAEKAPKQRSFYDR